MCLQGAVPSNARDKMIAREKSQKSQKITVSGRPRANLLPAEDFRGPKGPPHLFLFL